MTIRVSIEQFALANPLYAGASVTFYTVDASGNKTATLATLYAADSGSDALANPQELNSEGKFYQPVFVDQAVIGSVTGLSVTDHDTGVIHPADISTAMKEPVRVATTANITLSGLQTIDGVALSANDRVLVKDQSTGSENGIYIAKTGTWSRAPDADRGLYLRQGTLVRVTSGTVNSGYIAELTTSGSITVGTTALTYAMRLWTLGVVSGFMQTALDDADADTVIKTFRDNATAETAPAVDDEFLIYDLSAGLGRRMSVANMLKVVNALTAESSLDSSADYALVYDASAAAVRKVLLSNLVALSTSVLDRDVTVATVTGTTTETTVYTYTVPGNTLASNRSLRLTLRGDLAGDGGTGGNLTVRVKYGATTIATFVCTVNATASKGGLALNYDLSAQNATNAQSGIGTVSFTLGGSSMGGGAHLTSTDMLSGHNAITEDSTADKALTVTFQNDANAVTSRCLFARLELL